MAFRLPSLALAALLLAGVAHAQAPTPPTHTPADVRFMQDMIHHHAQAVEMVRLVRPRTENETIRRLAHRIGISQSDEIQMMQRWLLERGEQVPDHDAHAHHGHVGHRHHDHHHHHAGHDDPHAHHGHHGHHGHAAPDEDPHAGMPGMLSREQMARLAAASDAEFDRLFLEYMIYHHEGALVMVEELFAQEGAGQEIEIFRFASHVDADQRAEIRVMRQMLADLP